MKPYTDADRPALLDLLKLHGPLNVPRLARLRGVAPTAVRQQLAALEREGLVRRTETRQRRGRPTHLFALTEKAEALFPQAYGPMALALLREIRRLDGDAKIEALLSRRTRDLAARYRRRLAGMTVEEKFRELARIRDEEGYMARSRPQGLTEHHCPIAAIAREFPQVCQHEKRLFEAVLGRKLDWSEFETSPRVGENGTITATATSHTRITFQGLLVTSRTRRTPRFLRIWAAIL